MSSAFRLSLQRAYFIEQEMSKATPTRPYAPLMTPWQSYRSNNEICKSLGTKAVIVCLLVPVRCMLLKSGSVRSLLKVLPACLADD